MDLTSAHFEKANTFKLDGEWEFYWDSFLNYSDLQQLKPDLFAKVPSTWNGYSIDGESIPGHGYATYRAHIKTDLPENALLGFRISTFSSAYRLFVNDKLIASNGSIGKSAEEEVGEYRPQAVFFNVPSKEFDIIIQVSNFHYARGGFWYSLYMGNAQGILALQERSLEKEAYLLGAMGIISVFFFAVYLLRRELKYSLYFACLCISMAVAVDSLGQLILFGLLPGLSLNATIFIWYSSSIWVFYFLMLFMHELFKSGFSAAAIKIYFGVTTIFQLLFIFAGTTFYSGWPAHISDIINIIGAVCTVVIIAIGIKKGYKDGWFNIVGIAVALIAYIHDDLYWMNVISASYGELIYIGLFIFLFIQMVIQAKRIKLFYDHKTAAELSFFQAQIKPHFLYNAINTIVSISQYDTDQARSLLINFSNYLRRSFDFKNLRQTVPLKNEIELAKAYIEIEKARFEERLEVEFDVCDAMEVEVPMLVLQPIIENAVIHGVLPKPEGGRIKVSVRTEGKLLLFSVKDNGVGIEPQMTSSVLKREFGSGIGLSNINNRLKKLYGKGFQINSSPDIGTEVTWAIPLKQRGE